MYRVTYRPKPSAPWESCYLVAGGRQKAIESAKQITAQERCLGTRGQAGIMKETAKKVTIIRDQEEQQKEQQKEGN